MKREEFQEIAWRDFIVWAAQEPKMRDSFCTATGQTWLRRAANPIAAMIDAATGYDDAAERQLNDFVLWVTEHHWGIDEAPPAVREAIAGRAALAEQEGEP